MTRTGIAVTGYPGAGKSLAGDRLEEHLDGIQYETGDIVRRGAARHFGLDVGSISSEALGKYSTMRREKDGGDYVMQDVFDNLKRNPNFPSQPAIITGMRDSVAPMISNRFFDRFIIVWLEAGFSTRLERIQGRGRQDEADFTPDDLRDRDERERKWGTDDLHKWRDVVIPNEGSRFDLDDRLKAVEHLL